MSSQTTSIIDHGRLEAAARDIRSHAADFDVEQECQAVLDAFDREVQEGVEGAGLGIWEEPRANLAKWLQTIQEKVAEVRVGMVDDAQWLEDVSKKAREIQDGAAGQAQQLGQNLGGGIGTNSSTFDPSRFRDVTPSIAVPTAPNSPDSSPTTPTAPTDDGGDKPAASDPAAVQQRVSADPSAAAQAVAQNASDISTVMQRIQGDGVLADLIQRAEGAGFRNGDKSNAELWTARADWLKSHPEVLAQAFSAHPSEWGAAIAANPALARSVAQ